MNVRSPVAEDTGSDVALSLAEVTVELGPARVSSSGLPSLLIPHSSLSLGSRLCVSFPLFEPWGISQ